MDIAVVGTGFIGGILGPARWRGRGTRSRWPATSTIARWPGTPRRPSLRSGTRWPRPTSCCFAIPGPAVGAARPASTVTDSPARLLIDATNRMGAPVANARADLPGGVRYARAFNTLGGENFERPDFADGPADLFFSAPEADRDTVESIIGAVGLRPVYLGADQEELVDALFRCGSRWR